MIEAKITCLTGSLRLPDLNLHLTKGMTVYMDEKKARNSKDLERAWRGKGVEIQYVSRVAERRAPRPENTNPRFPAPPGMGFTPPPPPPSREDNLLFDPDLLAERVVEAINTDAVTHNKVRLIVTQQLAGLEDRIVARVVEAIKSEIASGISVHGGPLAAPVHVHGTPSGTTPLVDDVPVFIPSRIRTDGLTAEIDIQSQQGDAGGLSDAAAALRKARNAGKK